MVDIRIYYFSISILLFLWFNLISFTFSRIFITFAFTLQSYGCPARLQAPVDSLLIEKDFLWKPSSIIDWGFPQKFFLDCLAYCLYGLPFFIARKKAKVMTVIPE